MLKYSSKMCPECNTVLAVENISLDKFCESEIMELETRCSNKRQGCNWTGPLKGYKVCASSDFLARLSYIKSIIAPANLYAFSCFLYPFNIGAFFRMPWTLVGLSERRMSSGCSSFRNGKSLRKQLFIC